MKNHMQVPLLDLRQQLQPLREEILAAVTEVIDSTGYILGPRVASLEQEVAAYCGAPHGIGVTSGTDALLIALMALEIGPGDLVLTTPYSFFATVGSILRLGARPVFVDIDPVSYNLDPEAAGELLARFPETTARIKAMIPVHLYGQCADMEPLLALADCYGFPVIEDAAQAIGAMCPLSAAATWQRAGSMGTAGCFSFFPSKNLGGIGDGGMVVCRDKQLAEKMRILRVHGSAPKYHHRLIGGNFRLDPIQAAVLSIKLRYLPEWHRARRRNADRYRRLFAESGLAEEGGPRLPVPVWREPAEADGVDDFHIYNQFVIRVEGDRRDALLAHLAANGVGAEIYYPVPLHKQQCLAGMGYGEQQLPEAERAARETLALPIYPELTEEMQVRVVEVISSFYRDKKATDGA